MKKNKTILIGLFSLFILPLPTSADETWVTGTLNAAEECNGEFASTAWIASESHPIPPVTVAIRGTFEFKLPPGKHQIIAKSTGDCSAQQSIEITQTKKPYSVVLKLEKHRSPTPLPGAPSIQTLSPFQVAPHTYISGRPGTRFKASVHLPEANHWKGAIPAHGPQGWEGKLHVDGKFFSGNAVHPYLRYQFTVDPQKLQDQAGFCMERAGLFKKLGSILRQAGFGPNEVSDLEKTVASIPPSQKYCVYPQGQSVIQPLAHLKMDPIPASTTRLLFVIVSEETLHKKSSLQGQQKFVSAPPQAWDVGRELASDPHRHPANVSEIEVHEWAIGWIYE